MNKLELKISAGLEQAFAKHGFADPNMQVLRDASGVSLRTLYKYFPSREKMVLAALEHRHLRYLEHIFHDMESGQSENLEVILERIANWMAVEASHGCLFHSAVASAPGDLDLRDLLNRHKAEVAQQAVLLCGMPDREMELTTIFEGLTQSWPLYGDKALNSAKVLSSLLMHKEPASNHDADEQTSEASR